MLHGLTKNIVPAPAAAEASELCSGPSVLLCCRATILNSLYKKKKIPHDIDDANAFGTKPA